MHSVQVLEKGLEIVAGHREHGAEGRCGRMPDPVPAECFEQRVTRRAKPFADRIEQSSRDRVVVGVRADEVVLAQAALDEQPRLKPRFYSISSSPRARPDEIALTVGALSVETADGRVRPGLCSSMLHRLRPGDRALVSVKAPPRRLPDAPGAPLLLIGAGTGIAPLYAALEDRAAREEEEVPGETALIFGCLNAGDVAYEDDLLRWRREGLLVHTNTAFSRASRRRVLVQAALEAEWETVWAAFGDPRAIVFVSGDARMADGVFDRLVDIAQTAGKLAPLEAVDRLERMRQEGRYVADVWSVHPHHAEAIGQLRQRRHTRAERWLQRPQRAGSRVSSRFVRG